jgi:hypothetical protein
MSHLWQRLHEHDRLGLILGAGASYDAGCPLWTELIKLLAQRVARGQGPAMRAHRRAALPETYLTQILYFLHGEKMEASSRAPTDLLRFHVRSTWMDIVHKLLYKKNERLSFTDIAERHPYLSDLGELVCRSGFVVNFNFDDIVDEAAIRHAESATPDPLPLPEVIWRPRVDSRRGATVIYHINGFLPHERKRRRSDSLIFTEEAFADVLISPNSLDAEFTMSKFGNTTFLILGTSLTDNSLKNMLRAGIQRNAANHHYIVYLENGTKPRSNDERLHIFNVNLEVYNLISIFLDTKGISEFLQILNQPQNEFVSRLAYYGVSGDTLRRRYYLIGSIASGKSSNLEALRCFATYEEWSKRPPAIMYQDFKTLTPEEDAEVNAWIYGQLRDKNQKMQNSSVGISVMDRGFFDLFAFSKTDAERLIKAGDLATQVVDVGGRPLTRGHVWFLEADESSYRDRLARRGVISTSSNRGYRPEQLVEQSAALRSIYKPSDATVVNTGRSPCDVTSRKIARDILLGSYAPFDFTGRLRSIRRAGGNLG